MARGLDGWNGLVIRKIQDARRGLLVFWTWKGSKPDRKFGHVGAVVVGRETGLMEAAHASSSHNSVVVVPFRGALLRDIEFFRDVK